MKLPAELRLAIYELTLNDTIEYTSSSNQSSSTVGSQMRAQDGLALILTSKTIRAECSKALLPLWSAHLEVFDQAVVILERNRDLKLQAPLLLALPQLYAILNGSSVIRAEEAEHAYLQATRQLDNAYIERRAKVAVQLALQRAANVS